jgi:zinc protease
MRSVFTRLGVAAVFLASAYVAWAQTADEILERSLKAIGGRPALSGLKSQLMSGTVTISTPGGDIPGTIEILTAAPNKSRTLVKADLTALGAGQIEIDQRFDGSSGYVIDTLQGNREITGNQLDNMRNSRFPHPFMNYKDNGTTAKLTGKEKVGDREAFVIELNPKSGSLSRQFIDAETYMPMKFVMKVDVPQLGGELEQTTEFSDYREVNGMKYPFRIRTSSSAQNITITISKIDQNVPVDDKLFVKPAAR